MDESAWDEQDFLLYFGTAEPAYYGIDAVYLPGRFLRPRLSVRTTSPEMPHTMAVSANYFYAAQVYATPAEALTLKSVRLKKPDAVVGGSILIFNLDLPTRK